MGSPPRRLVIAVLPLLCAASCPHRPTPKERQAALVHYDIGVQSQTNGDTRGALAAYQKSLELDPDLDLAHNAIALLLHISFHKPDEAIAHYQRALQINPKFSDAAVNLGNVYSDLGQYDQAIPLYQQALADMLYKSPYIAENNLGWALYKKGQVDEAIQHIKAALVHNPKFCQGWRNVGIISAEQNRFDKARDAFEQYAKDCPEQCDAYFRLAKARLSLGDQAGARTSLESCSKTGEASDCGAECRRLLEMMK
jgi:type IV pilus assembly protein PilF